VEGDELLERQIRPERHDVPRLCARGADRIAR